MAGARVADLLSAAREDGVGAAGLRLHRTDGGYDLSVGERTVEEVSEERVREVLAEHPAHVDEWYFWMQVAPDAPERRAFLRWIEGLDDATGPSSGMTVPGRRERLRDGVSRAWGQVRVHVELTADGRVYELRHVEDTDVGRDALDVHHDPLDARKIRKTDGRGRYRPLSTAPTLQRGWVFVDLSARAVVRTVEAFYPATVANWHREREGRLDVTHWHEAVSRQTGIYGLVETWDRGEGHEHVEWVAEACCDDSQCLKRREWEYDAETDLDVDGSPADGERAEGAGVFPCREPCSLVIAGARKWTRLEAQEPRTYEFELTPGEKEQVETIIDAVADGRVEDIREGDFGEGANRYRARFLRAKRFDDGDLCGVPTEPDEESAGESNATADADDTD
jgi:hypothetical protein